MTSLFKRAHMSNRRGFTLIELLVVIAILATLIAILIPTLARARVQVQKTTCAANLTGQGKSFLTYSAANDNILPNFVPGSGGGWLHDQPYELCGQLLGLAPHSGDTASPGHPECVVHDWDARSNRKWFYCPTNPAANSDAAWHGVNPTSNPLTEVGGAVVGSNSPLLSRPFIDYIYFNQRGVAGGVPATGLARSSGKLPKLQFRKSMIGGSFASDAELAGDELVSSTNAGTDFDQPCQASYFKEVSNHLSRGKLPEGMNILAMDGHVSWKAFPGVAGNNVTPVTQQAPGAVFWIVDP